MEPPLPEPMAPPRTLHLRDPIGLWGWLRGFLILYIVVTLASAAVTLIELYTGLIDLETFDAVTAMLVLAALGIGVFSILITITCVVLTCRITYRMMRNLHELQAPEAEITPRWAVGWYFIPFANLVMPIKAVRQMWRGTFGLLGEEGKESPVTPWWWGAWIAGNITANISWRLTEESGGFNEFGPHDLGLYRLALHLDLASAVLSVIAAVLMIQVFGPLAQTQADLVRGRTGG